MTTSQIQRRLVDFGFYHIQPPHPSHGQALLTSLSPPSVSLFFLLWKLNLKLPHAHIHTHTHTHSHTDTHTFPHTLLFCLLRPNSGSQHRNDNKSNYLGSFPWGTQSPPAPILITHCCHHPLISHPLSVCHSLTHTHPLCDKSECQYCFSERVAEWT